MKRSWISVSALGLVLLALAASSWARPVARAPVTAAQTNGGSFTCEATLLRIENLLGSEFELGEANEGEAVCNTDDGSVLGSLSKVDLGILKARLLFAETDDDADGTKQGLAESGVAEVVLTIGTKVIEVDLLTAEAQAGPCPSKALSGDSVVAGVFLDGVPVLEVPASGDYLRLDLSPVGILHLNWRETSANKTTRRALFLEDAPVVGDVVIAEAVADVHGNPCGSTATPSGSGTPTPGNRHAGFLTGGSWVAETTSKWDKNDDGTVEPGTRVGASASLDCFTSAGVDPRPGHHHLGVRWTDEDGNEKSNFKLDELTDTVCSDTAATANPPQSSWDTMEGDGTGTCSSGSLSVPVTIHFRFTDDGESGAEDSLFIDTDIAPGAETPDGLADLCDYESQGKIDGGNVQAHGRGGTGSASSPSRRRN